MAIVKNSSTRGATRINGGSPKLPRSANETKSGASLVLSRLVQAKTCGLWLPVNLSLEAWCQIGLQITAISNSSSWWIGDWLLYGRKRFPDRYKQAIEETSLDYQTLRNYAWVSRQFPVCRRRGRLSFQHHAEVASLPPAEQDAWLDKAEAARWPTHELRRQLKASGAGMREPSQADVPSSAVITVKLEITADQKTCWQAAATASRAELQDWILSALDAAARVRILDVG